jgi:hypothetical protein
MFYYRNKLERLSLLIHFNPSIIFGGKVAAYPEDFHFEDMPKPRPQTLD